MYEFQVALACFQWIFRINKYKYDSNFLHVQWNGYSLNGIITHTYTYDSNDSNIKNNTELYF